MSQKQLLCASDAHDICMFMRVGFVRAQVMLRHALPCRLQDRQTQDNPYPPHFFNEDTNMPSALFSFRTLLLAAVIAAPISAQAQFTEHFDDVTTLSDWYFQNNSNPVGVTGWFQGTAGVFDSYDGAPEAYIAANFNSTGDATNGVGTISNWMLTPELVLEDGAVFSFFTRVPGSVFPDRLELRLSTSGSSTSVGDDETSVGDFGSLLLTVNPNLSIGGYPDSWTEYSVTLDGIVAPTTGRFGFRYFVDDGGPLGANSNYIGIDEVSFGRATVVPEPASVALMAVGLFGLAIVRRRRAS